MTDDKALVGAAGVHYVAFQLASRGYAVGLTPPGVATADLLAWNPSTDASMAIQVKTMRNAFVASRKYGKYWKWRIGKNLAIRTPPAETLFVLFVDLCGGPPEAPGVYVVSFADLQELQHGYPEASPKEQQTDFWVDIDEKDAPKYKDRWEGLVASLQSSPTPRIVR